MLNIRGRSFGALSLLVRMESSSDMTIGSSFLQLAFWWLDDPSVILHRRLSDVLVTSEICVVALCCVKHTVNEEEPAAFVPSHACTSH
jgi:hypothetical protein